MIDTLVADEGAPTLLRNDWTLAEVEALVSLEQVVDSALQAQAAGATRFCMGAAWRSPTDQDLAGVVEMVEAVHDIGMETCVTLGMLTEDQAQRLSEAGLDFNNHNLDTSSSCAPSQWRAS